MDDTPTPEQPKKEFNKLDLTQLQSFSFGTQWSQDKGDPSGRSSRDRDDRPRRDGGGPGDMKRDRRVFRRPAGGPSGAPDAPPSGAPAGGDRREGGYQGRPPSREGGGPPREGGVRPPFRGGPRREGPGGGGQGFRPPQERGPYISPYYTVTFYPEDSSFSALAKTIRSSCRTFELFDIAKTVIGKNDRFVVVAQRKAPEGPQGAPASEADAAAARLPLFLSVPDGLPFETEEAALNHVLGTHLDRFFDAAEVEVEPPKGNFQVINKCGVTGELLGPPNYHRYTQIVQQHHASRLPRMAFDVFRSRIESVRDPEVVNQWLEKMKKVTRYAWKLDRPAASAAPAAAPAAPAESAPAEEGAPETEPTEATEAGAAEAAAPAAPSGPTFDSLVDARVYLLTQARDKAVRPIEHARFHGRLLEPLPDSELKRAIEGALERQRRFPLDTANALRGRLRREGFTIFKKGSKGISYVCAVKRKFRVPGQTFADSIGQLISFIEAHPMVKASELSQKFLGQTPPPAGQETPPSIDDQARLSRMQGDLRWLVTEGYVTEFIDGGLFAPPPMVEARKRELESGEGDLENFPEAPKTAAPPAREAVRSAQPTSEPAAEMQDEAPSPEPEAAPAEQDAAPAEPEAAPAESEAAPTEPEAPPADRQQS